VDSICRFSTSLVWGILDSASFRFQLQHVVDQADDLIVPGDVGGIIEVDGTDGKLLDELGPKPHIPTPQSRSYSKQILKKKARVEQTQYI